MDRICEVDRRRPARKLYDLPHRRERVNVFREKVELVTGNGYPVLETLGNRRPDIMYDAEGKVAVRLIVRSDNARGDQVVNLFDHDPLLSKFFPKRVKPLNASLDRDKGHLILVQSGRDRRADLFKYRFELGTPGIDFLCEFLVFIRK